jgi:hypothetical protein
MTLAPPLDQCDDDDERWVCALCVGEPFLHDRIVALAFDRPCWFCGKTGPAVPVAWLADEVEMAFASHYVRTSNEPDGFEYAMMSDPDSSYEFERGGEEVLWAVAGAAEVSEEVAQEVLDILGDRHADFDSAAMGEECEFDPESYYERRGPNDIEFQLGWRSFEQSLRTENRYFNKEAEALLERIFAGIETFRDHRGRPVIQTAGPGLAISGFHRARVFHADEGLRRALERPDRELGPPPSSLAVAGRMNAHGVSLFYGATDPAAALAEIRPPAGSRALLGSFEVVRPLRLLDIDALRSVYVEGSVFDAGYMGRLELAKFLESLGTRMTMPVMPADEPSEYLITQVIADYLATDTALRLDGILYPSAQRRGQHSNVVLFRKASRVEGLQLPSGSQVSASLSMEDEDGASPYYRVWEEVPPPPPAAGTPAPRLWPGPSYNPFAEPSDDREVALHLSLESLVVHHVTSVTIGTEPHAVPRHRSERRSGVDPDF